MFDLQTYCTLQMKLEKLDKTQSIMYMSQGLGDIGGTGNHPAPRFAVKKLVLYDIVLDRNKTPFKFKEDHFGAEVSNFYKNESYRQSRLTANSPRSSPQGNAQNEVSKFYKDYFKAKRASCFYSRDQLFSWWERRYEFFLRILRILLKPFGLAHWVDNDFVGVHIQGQPYLTFPSLSTILFACPHLNLLFFPHYFIWFLFIVCMSLFFMLGFSSSHTVYLFRKNLYKPFTLVWSQAFNYPFLNEYIFYPLTPTQYLRQMRKWRSFVAHRVSSNTFRQLRGLARTLWLYLLPIFPWFFRL